MIYDLIDTLIKYALDKELIKDQDVVYFKNKIIEFLGLDEYKEGRALDISLEELCEKFDDYAVEKGIINDTVSERDIFDTRLISLLVDRPSAVIEKFYSLYNESREKATDWFYDFSMATNYVRKYRIVKDLRWTKKDDRYGRIDISINLSKPEKDPKDIERQKFLPKNNYPMCLLCKENEGYSGRLNHPARGNIRLIPFKLCGSDFFMQYSPYSYYNEHCIVLSKEHKPMVINKDVVKKLLDFVTFLPHYFIGSNAGLPIVGGSILAHEHFQGGKYRFPIQDAPVLAEVPLVNHKNVNAKLIKWPLSVIRIESADKDALADAFGDIYNVWSNYSDEEAGVFAVTDDTPHNAITPIARKNDLGLYELDVVLRNNITSEEYPMGVFHAHPEYHNIKKENIGLIEVMGLAVLPARLKTELSCLAEKLVNGEDILNDETLKKHYAWSEELKKKYKFTKENVDEILKTEVANVFFALLENCGVFKQTEKGIAQFKKFIDKVNEK